MLRVDQLRLEPLKSFFRSRQLLLQYVELRLFRLGRRFDYWRGITVFAGFALLRNVVEVTKELVKLLLFERVVLMIVTSGATHGEAEEYGGCRLDTVHHVLNGVFFGN